MKKMLLIIGISFFSVINCYAASRCELMSENICNSDEWKNECVWTSNVRCVPRDCSYLSEDKCNSVVGCYYSNGECSGSVVINNNIQINSGLDSCDQLDLNSCKSRVDCDIVDNKCVNYENNQSNGNASTSEKSGNMISTKHDPIDICETSGFLKAIQILKTLFKIVCVIIPIILIITITLDASKLISEPSDFKKVFPIIKNRLLAALIILFIPTIVKITMKVIPKDSNFDNFVKCVENATEENIQDLESREKEKANNNSNNSNNNTNENGHWRGTTIDEDSGGSHLPGDNKKF